MDVGGGGSSFTLPTVLAAFPTSFGSVGQIPQIGAGNTIVWGNLPTQQPTTGVTTFVALTDTPATLGSENQVPTMRSGAMTWVTPPITALGNAGTLPQVNNTGVGVNWRGIDAIVADIANLRVPAVTTNSVTLGGVPRTTWPAEGVNRFRDLTDAFDPRNFPNRWVITDSSGQLSTSSPPALASDIPTTISDLTDVPIYGTNGTFLGVVGGVLAWATPPVPFRPASNSPRTGDVLTAISRTTWSWQTPAATGLAVATNTPTTGQVLTATSATAWNWATPTSGGASAFTDLSDTPSALGTGLQIVRMNSAATALEYHTPKLLGDYPSELPSSFGQPGEALVVNNGRNALEWRGAAGSFTGLSDTPSSYAGLGGRYLRVNSTTSMVEADVLNVTDIHEFPDTLGTVGQVPRMATSSTIEWYTPTSGGGGASAFTGLSDTPNSLGLTGQVPRVNTARDKLEWYTPVTPASDQPPPTFSGVDTTKSDTSGVALTGGVGELTILLNEDNVDDAGLGMSWGSGAQKLKFSSIPDNTYQPVRVYARVEVTQTGGLGTWQLILRQERFSGRTDVPNIDTVITESTPSSTGTKVLAGFVNTRITDNSSALYGLVARFTQAAGQPTTTLGVKYSGTSKRGLWLWRSEPDSLSTLRDTPTSLGTTSQVLAVNAARDSTEWVHQEVATGESLPNPDNYKSGQVFVTEDTADTSNLFVRETNELTRNRFTFTSGVDSASTTNEVGWSQLPSVGDYGTLASDGHGAAVTLAVGALQLIPGTSCIVHLYPTADKDSPTTISSVNLGFTNLDTKQVYTANLSPQTSSDITIGAKKWLAFRTTNATSLSNVLDVFGGRGKSGSRIAVDIYFNPGTRNTSGTPFNFRPSGEWKPIDTPQQTIAKIESAQGEDRLDLAKTRGSSVEFVTEQPQSYEVGDQFYNTRTQKLWMARPGSTAHLPQNRLVAHMVNAKSTGFDTGNTNGLIKQFDLQVSGTTLGGTLTLAPSLLRGGVTSPATLYITLSPTSIGGKTIGTMTFQKQSLQSQILGVSVDTYFADDITVTTTQGSEISRYTGDLQLNLWTNSGATTSWDFRPVIDIPESLIEIGDPPLEVVQTLPAVASSEVGKLVILAPTGGLASVQAVLPSASTGHQRNLIRVTTQDGSFNITRPGSPIGSSSDNYHDFLRQWTWSHSGNTLTLTVYFIDDNSSTEIGRSDFPNLLYFTFVSTDIQVAQTGWQIPTTIRLTKGTTYGQGATRIQEYTYQQGTQFSNVSNLVNNNYTTDLLFWTDMAATMAWNFRPIRDVPSSWQSLTGGAGGLVGATTLTSLSTRWILGTTALAPPTTATWLFIKRGATTGSPSSAVKLADYTRIRASDFFDLPTAQPVNQPISRTSNVDELVWYRYGSSGTSRTFNVDHYYHINLMLARTSTNQMLWAKSSSTRGPANYYNQRVYYE